MGQGVVPSLPPAPVAEPPQTSPIELAPYDKTKESWYLPDNSKVRPVAMQIIAMRLGGHEDEEIAKLLGISPKSIGPYVYRATKNGWLNIDYDPKERIQFQMMHRVVERLEEGLEDATRMNTGMKVRTAVALKVFEGTVAKQFGEQPTQSANTTVVQVQVVMPDGPRQTIREDTTGGTPAYINAEVV